MCNNGHIYADTPEDTILCGTCGLESCFWDQEPCPYTPPYIPSLIVRVSVSSGDRYVEEWKFIKDGWRTQFGLMDGIFCTGEGWPIQDNGTIPLATVWRVLWLERKVWEGPVGDLIGITKVEPL